MVFFQIAEGILITHAALSLIHINWKFHNAVYTMIFREMASWILMMMLGYLTNSSVHNSVSVYAAAYCRPMS